MKSVAGLATFHAKKVQYIKQEIWARMILYNFCELITASVIIGQKSERKHAIQFRIEQCNNYLFKKPAAAISAFGECDKSINHPFTP